MFTWLVIKKGLINYRKLLTIGWRKIYKNVDTLKSQALKKTQNSAWKKQSALNVILIFQIVIVAYNEVY